MFGVDEDGNAVFDLSGQYRGEPQETFVMRKSYRAPRLLLMLAHTIGMGLKREDGPVQAITRQDGWDGYDVDGNFRKIGSEAVLRRPIENSPHPMQNELFPGELITHRSVETKADEHWVSKKIKADIQQEGLDPDQILVIPLCKGRTNDMKNKEFVAEELESLLGRHDIRINPVWENDNKIFIHEGKVTLAGVNRAKGDEAGSVYVLGVDAINTEQWRDQETHRRNRLFVAITRSGAWVSISGTHPNASIHTEVSSVVDDVQSTLPHVIFEVPNSRELANELEEGTEELESPTLDDF